MAALTAAMPTTSCPAMEKMMSLVCNPAMAAGLSAATPTISTGSTVSSPTNRGTPAISRMAKMTTAVRIFMKGPAAMTMMRRQGATVGKLPSDSKSPSSPAMRTKPPKGNQLSVYSTPLCSNIFHMRGGYPKPNSWTFTPIHLAARKWPNSCMKIRKPKTGMTARLVN